MQKIKYTAKQTISTLLSAVMVFVSLPNAYTYADSPKEIQPLKVAIQNESEVQTEQPEIYTLKKKGEVSEYGYQDMVWVDEDGNETDGDNSHEQYDNGLSRSSNIQLPSSYSMVDEGILPPVRNQGKWGTCWAHGSICSVETNMIKKGLADKSNVDYSERHLSYFAHKRNMKFADGTDSYDTKYSWYGGGNDMTATFQLAGWNGAAAESDYPYSSYGDMEDLDESVRSSSVCHLTDVNELNTSEEIKSAIMKNGSVTCSYYSDDVSIDNKNYAVYHTENLGINHLVSIVGWDDEYKASNFSGSTNGSTPESDGAWLCRNSWGSAWGNNGYFWISYEDATIGYFYSFEAEPADNYDNIYQYDGAGFNCSISYEKSANIFKSKSLEELKAVSFYLRGCYDYIIDIYLEKDGGMSNPSDGMLVYSQTGTLETPGYHTVKLDNSVILDSGIKYAVCVQFISKDGSTAYTYAERGDDYSSEAGQSFMYTGVNKWTDTKELSTNGIKNVCIKAFTDDLENIDKSVLETVITQAEGVNASDYTAASWETLNTELENAKTVYSMEDPNVSDIIKAKSSLESALLNLVPSKVYINNEEEFKLFAMSVSAGMDYDGQTVYLTEDLDMMGIEYSTAGNVGNPFMGTFDGNGHYIKNLTYEYKYSYGGIFGFIGNKGMVKDIGLLNADMSFGAACSGGIAAINEGIIRGCSIHGSILFDCTTSSIGGIAGTNRGTIEKSSITGTVTFKNQKASTYYVGGIAGNSTGTILGCFMRGEIISDGNASTAGIVGYSDESSIVKNCYNMAVISGDPTEDTKSAGIGVVLYGETSGCYNYGNILRSSSSAANGAIYCYQKGSISNCYYLDTSSSKGGYSPSSSSGSMTGQEFAEGKTAYYLNSNGGSEENSYQWSQKDGVPVSADSENKPVIKVNVSQNAGNEYKASLNGVTDGEFYANGSTEVSVQTLGDMREGYMLSAECTGLIPSDKGGNVYVLPDKDVSAIVTCNKKCIEYNITYILNRGSGTGPSSYNIETSVELPVPVKSNADFLGWYDNKDFNGSPVTEIPKGSTGNKSFWAKWYNYGFKVMFPQIKGLEIISCDGYENTGIQEEESYLFTVKAQKGYDISELAIKCEDTVLIPSDGVYRIDNITSDIDNISISGVRLGTGNYAIDGRTDYNGYVGKKAVITPVFPATMIRLAGEDEFVQSIMADTDRPVNVVLCDEDGNTGIEEQIIFKRDVTEPAIDSVTTPFADEKMNYKGVMITVNANDTESGVAEYSFDGGKTWQKDNYYQVLCEETETIFDKEIYVRDNVGNVAKYTGVVNIPAVNKYESVISIKSDKESYTYGSDILLTADITFGGYVTGNVSDYGKVTFITEEGHELGTAYVEAINNVKGRAQIQVTESEYGSIGQKVCYAIYDGTGTPYRSCESEKYILNIEKAVVSSVNTTIQSSISVSASNKYTEMQLRELINVNQVEVTTNTGEIYNLPVTWSTSDNYNIKGGIYNYTGTIHGNEFVDVPEEITLNTKIIVECVLLENPVLPDIEVEQRDSNAANAQELGNQVLPDTGTVTVNDNQIKFNIIWSQLQTIDLTTVGNSAEFTGTISYENVPEWITLPEYLNIKRKVKVIKSDNIGTVIKLAADSENYVYGEDIAISVNISAIGNQPVMPDSNNSYGKVYLYMYDESGNEYQVGCEELKESLSIIIKVGGTSAEYGGYGSTGIKTFYAVYEYHGRRQSLWSSTSDTIKLNILNKIPKPAKPSSITLIKKTKNSAQLKWSRVKGAVGYEVYRKNGSGSYKKYKTINGEKNVTLINKGLSKSGIYYYKVRAFVNGYDGKVYSAFSAVKSLKMSKSISSDELKISASKLKIKVKKSKTIKIVYPKGRSKSEIKSVKYKSDKNSVAKVSSKGKITAIKKGTTYITVTVKLKNGQTKKLKAKVTVIK